MMQFVNTCNAVIIIVFLILLWTGQIEVTWQ